MMRVSAWILIIVSLMIIGHTSRADIAVNYLDTPLQLFTESSPVNQLLDLNNDGITDFTFSADVSSVGVRPEGNNQSLIYPSPPPNTGGAIESLDEGFEIGPNSGDGELDWYGNNPFFSSIVICLDGSGGYTCVGRFGTTNEFPTVEGERAYMGVEFDIDGSSHYGWIDIQVGEISPYAIIHGWAYETTPGMGIIAGVVPEPSTVMLFSMGFVTLLFRKLRKQFR